MQSAASTVKDYFAELAPDRRRAMETVRNVMVDNLPAGFAEAMNWGMIAYEVPLSVVPDTYNGQPLMYAALASHKNHMAVYLSGIYADPELTAEFERIYRASGLRMDIGKSCVRFRRLEDLPLDLVGWAVGAVSMDGFIQMYLQSRSPRT
ncbi:MAG: DUF1801 domain-containing protein [Candidatus Nanopelagicales bacterium]|nr:DUF1801 domain-containing protein [Candidatus Nanopelagicales bacterium]MCF8539027.1 DUF1801 domain-containing protein [Candidatus Nanopelagicales bacterium]MCF8551191.1 DUF1801 domain-containing protein [Candidatus Nanopelagicales bacterium]